MAGSDFIRKYRYIILLIGTVIAFAVGFAAAFGIARICGVTVTATAVNAGYTVGGITGMIGFLCICLAELRRI